MDIKFRLFKFHGDSLIRRLLISRFFHKRKKREIKDLWN